MGRWGNVILQQDFYNIYDRLAWDKSDGYSVHCCHTKMFSVQYDGLLTSIKHVQINHQFNSSTWLSSGNLMSLVWEYYSQ